MLRRHQIFQTSLISSLVQGVYEDEMTVGELLGHGSFGIGTFNRLDGEMIILDGACYRLRVDGTVTQADLDDRTPYAVVTNFVPTLRREVEGPLTRAQISRVIDDMLPSSNYMYALRISGSFNWTTTRTVERQARPYRPMVEATANEEVIRLEHVTGIMAGFRTPLYEQGISVAGCHVHLVDDEHAHGGHLVDFDVDRALIEICICTDLQLRLPLTEEFGSADLAGREIQQSIRDVEHQ